MADQILLPLSFPQSSSLMNYDAAKPNVLSSISQGQKTSQIHTITHTHRYLCMYLYMFVCMCL